MPTERPRYAAPPPRRRWPLLLGGLVLVGGAAAALIALSGGQGDERRRAEEAEYAAASAATPLDASAAAGAHVRDGAAFDREHRARVVSVSGVVDRKESIDGPYGTGPMLKLYLRGVDGRTFLAQVGGEHLSQATPLEPGARVVVVGRYVGDDGYGALVLRGARVR